MNYSYKLPVLLMFVLLLSSQIQNAAETGTSAAGVETTTEPKATEKKVEESTESND